MSAEQRQVLEMLAARKITIEQAERLLAALNPGDRSGGGEVAGARPVAAVRPPAAVRPVAGPKYLRVLVDTNDQDGPTHVNVRVPILLLRAGVRLASLIPAAAQDELNRALHDNGIHFDVTQIKPENLDEVIDQLRDVSVDVEHKAEGLKIKVFAE